MRGAKRGQEKRLGAGVDVSARGDGAALIWDADAHGPRVQVNAVRHSVQKVRALEIVGPYRLRVEFADGLSLTIDFHPVLESELYGPLRDLGLFNAVSLDPGVHTLVWPNGADFDPATLHDWPEHEAEMAALAKRWESSARSSGRTG